MRFKKFTKLLLGVLCACLIAVGINTTFAFADEDNDYLYLGGFAAGFVLNTQNVEVIGMCEVPTDKGSVCPARDCGLKSGDIIKNLNGKEIKSVSDLTKAISDDCQTYKLEILRDGERIEVIANPIKDNKTGKNKLGLLVKDSLNGIGTVTYIDKAHNKFGSLGHPVTGMSDSLIEINGGSLYSCKIYDVKRGVRGNPGELKGFFDNSNMLAVIKKNCKCGIFGDISPDYDVTNLKKVKKGDLSEVSIGKAQIYSTLNGYQTECFDVSIVKVDAKNKDNRNFVLKIDDERLISASGGIVQGMSGSPIVQNGKIIGAVTHVFVNDPTRGYGIAIEHMTSSY